MLLEAKQLVKRFPIRGGFFFGPVGWVHAVEGVSFQINPGETLGLVGESGCGKTTLARMILRLVEPDGGILRFGDCPDFLSLSHSELKKIRGAQISMIFQDPYSSLNPRMRIGETIAEPLVIHHQVSRTGKKQKVKELLEEVGLSADFYDRYPHEFSGGQRQRIGIARALALRPRLVVADEPVSALDVSVSSQIVNLLEDFQDKLGLAYLFISHDLKVVSYLSHHIAVMYLGKIVEKMPKAGLKRPLHPYTQALLAAVPVIDSEKRQKKIILSGEIPSPAAPPPGCSFHTRCPYAEKRCREEEPVLREFGTGHVAACHFVEKINA